MSGSVVVEVPAAWAGLVHPRRGGLVVRTGVEPAAGAVARLERLVEETAAAVSALVEAATGPVTS